MPDVRLLIARRYLVSRKQVTLISVITGISVAGVALGAAALVVVLSVMNGFYDFVRDLLVSLDPHVRIESAEGGGFARADSLLGLVEAVPYVASASAYVEGKALLAGEVGNDVNRVLIVRGVDPETWQGVSRVVEETGFGSFDLERVGGRPGIVVGEGLGQALALIPGTNAQGSEVALLSAPALEQLLTNPFGGLRQTRFQVRGLYKLEDVYDETHVFVRLDEAQRLFRLDGRVTGIELRLDDLERAEEVKASLEALLPADRFVVRTWYDLQRSLYDVMRLEKWGASAILALIIVVAAFNIVGSLMMVVVEKRHDIGVLQAMGLSKRGVRRIFLLEGLLIGLVGGGLGLGVGLTLALVQQQFGLVPLASAESFIIDAYPVAIRPLDVALIATVAVGLCVLAAWYPAARAAAVDPARAVHVDG